MALRATLVIAVLLLLALPLAAAHVPLLEEGGSDVEGARVVDDPTKSWVIYTTYDEAGRADYYKLTMQRGDNITVMLSVPVPEGERGFAPAIVLMGPGLEEGGGLPERVERPNGSGAMLRQGEIPSEITYEPFSPSTFYELAEFSLDAPADGDYYVAVFDDDDTGDYSLAIGKRESFTVGEWLTIPLDLVRVYRWEGQEWWAIALPGALTFLVGLAAMTAASHRRLHRPDRLWLMAVLSGLLMTASGVTVAYQMAMKLIQVGAVEPTALVTVLFAALAVAAGLAALRVAHRPRGLYGVGLWQKVAMLALGLLGLLFWAGWLVGPALAILAGVLPRKWLNRPLRH